MTNLLHRWQNLPRPQLLVLGDLMLDRYTMGDAERVSPEAPVLVLCGQSDDVRPGGAANVVSFLRGLEAEVSVVGVVGNDGDGRMLRRLLDDLGADHRGVHVLDDRPTTVKHRFVGRTGQKQPHQLLRVDHECRDPLPAEIEQELQREIRAQLGGCAALLISDYAKGVCTPAMVRYAIDFAWRSGVPVLVDPSRESDAAKYAQATVITPNRRAAEVWSGHALPTPDAALATAAEFRQQLQVNTVVITLDRDGLAFATESEGGIVPCRPRQICDVTGAGDMVLAVLGLCYAAQGPLRDSLQLANVAAGLEVERFGVEPVSRAEIAAELRGPCAPDKLVTLDRLQQLVQRHQQHGRSIVFTNGCFDLLHVGHVTLLQEAATLGDVLIVAINSDASVRRLKGPTRPVIAEQDRARMLAAMGCVDHVVVFDEDTPHRLLHALRPDVLVKGGTTADIVGSEIVEDSGGQIIRLGETSEVSTTRLVQKIRRTEPGTVVEGRP
jgi:D-beta-D-heptose 7-phosphate kinase / D-beta-D-heptose 1-phosphate adenosyltransferase